ncbi:unnamed protein product [Candidula unifasciata]|uniref:SHSP domain-containing protein n=1 Tax=Candidula unifasciata TaxID=100452 RepID=A0A8S4AB72_9EUPU|nr:unnamed protein product [Candidula unifasciata]
MFPVTPRFSPFDEDFAVLRLADELLDPRYSLMVRASGDGNRPAPSRSLVGVGRPGESEIHNTDKEFRVRLDLHHFRPEEVNITSDNVKIVINAKHEEKEDNHGFVTREMTRIYKLPPDVDAKSVTSTMNGQGVLTIRVAKRAPEAPKEIQIPVNFL